MGKNVVVIGAQWGDEGKGKVVDLLTENAAAVVRFQGGHNAGSHLGHRRPEDRFAPDPLRHPARRGDLPDRQWRGAVAGGAADRNRRFGAPGRGRDGAIADQRSLSADPALPCRAGSGPRKARGERAIGTTGRGIGPAYEDKVARRAVRLADLFDRERFAAKLAEVMDFHNFVLQRYFETDPVDFRRKCSTRR
jgi:adenylosuccinate synthase